MTNIAIVGSSGHAKVIIDIVERQGHFKIVGLLDRYRKVGEQTLGYKVMGSEDELPSLRSSHKINGILVAVGDNFVRSRLVANIQKLCPGIEFVRAIHPHACIAEDVKIGEGTVIMGGCVVNSGSSVGRFCILNTNSSLDHDSVMQGFSSLAPGSTTGGNCNIGNHSAVGIGAILTQNVTIGEHTIIGAGALVLDAIDSHVVAYGTPARVTRSREPGENYL